MRAFVASLIVLTCSGFASATEIYKVLHRRPSALLANLVGASGPKARIYEISSGSAPLISPGVTLKADDAASTILIEGSKDAALEMARVVAQFDVSPQHVIARVVIVSKADKYQTKCDVEIANNSPWTLDDSTLGLTLRISPRINGDGTITGHLELTSLDAHVNMATRVANGKSLTFAFGEKGIIGNKPGEAAPDQVPPIEITIRFEIVKR
jgi:type II secretory pathway component GspD/PulD (secretin)